jgi:hypothetical protein
MGQFVDRSRKLRLRVATLIGAKTFTSARRAALSLSSGERDYGSAIERVAIRSLKPAAHPKPNQRLDESFARSGFVNVHFCADHTHPLILRDETAVLLSLVPKGNRVRVQPKTVLRTQPHLWFRWHPHFQNSPPRPRRNKQGY